MNRYKWIDTLTELRNLTKYKQYDAASEQAGLLLESLLTEQHDLTPKEYYTTLLDLAECLTALGNAKPDTEMLAKGNEILAKYQEEFVLYVDGAQAFSDLAKIKLLERDDPDYEASFIPQLIIGAIVVLAVLYLWYHYG